MSPPSLRRYRAERLLRQEFEALRATVIAIVRGRLRAGGVGLDESDLEACYAQAWQGLYAAVLDGQEIENPTGWLALVTFRRAIDEHRVRIRVHCRGFHGQGAPGSWDDPDTRMRVGACVEADRDFAAELDDRMKLRQLLEAMRVRLSARELQAAALCYLQGLSRSEAAVRMGVSETRMRKLMEGTGAGCPGVAGKVGALVETIRGGGWCEEQGSLMRGFAYGILDPEGERYQLALIHSSECPACRAYVVSLRGLAAVLPPLPSLLHWALGSGAVVAKGAGMGGAMAANAQAGAAVGRGTAAGTGGAVGASGAAGAGAAGAGAAGAGAAGGGWLLAGGPFGAKLAVGCVLAVGVGASCVVLSEGRRPAGRPAHMRLRARAGAPSPGYRTLGALASEARQTAGGAPRGSVSARPPSPAGRALTGASRVSREFGPEQGLTTLNSKAGGSSGLLATAGRPARLQATAKVASVGAERARAAEFSGEGVQPVSARAGPGQTSPAASAAQREFAPG